MDKINKKFTILIIGLILLTILLGFALIYAKYISSAYGNTKMAIARWDIKVNNLSIKDNTNISNTLKPIFPGNSNIAANIIAPTAEGYFDLNFDFHLILIVPWQDKWDLRRIFLLIMSAY